MVKRLPSRKKCPKCGGVLFLMRDYDPLTKQYKDTYRYTHITNLRSLLKGEGICAYVEHVSVKEN